MSKPWEDYAEAPPWEDFQQKTRNNNLGAQAGLTARAGLQALGGLAGLVTDPIGGLLNKGAEAVGSPARAQTARSMATRLADAIGLPQPDTPTQRIVAQGAEMMAGAGGLAGATNLLSRGLTGTSQAVAQRLADNPLMQVASAGGAGAAGQQAKESGATPTGQFVSSLVGGLGAAGAVGGGQALANSARNFLSPAMKPQEIERRITVALQNQGVDPKSICPAIKSALMEDVKKALKTGGTLDDAAVARLADYRRLGLQPTKGRITLDPMQITQEQNAMRMAAATGADGTLPQLASRNNSLLLSKVDDFAPNADRTVTGTAAMAPILQRDAAMAANERALYDAARSLPGGQNPIPPGPMMETIFKNLDADLKTPFLPAEIAGILNKISKGEMPLDVRTIDVLKTMVSTAQRSSGDGNVRRALSIVRDGLDNAPLTPPQGGNQLVTAVDAARMSGADDASRGLMDALNTARRAAAQRRGWQESAPGITKALDGATPETFIDQQILSKSASVSDVTKLAAEMNDPAAIDAVRSAIVQKLKDAAIGRGNASETGNFSGRGWMSALNDIGERKLKLFFDADEVEQLKALGRVGTYETFQPRGSAVNNSNTAAGVGNLIQGLGRFVKPIANKIPLGQEALSNPLDNITLSIMERGAMNIPGGLLAQQQLRPRGGLLDPLIFPGAVMSGGLLAPSP
jgi:hypothetical protein